MCGIKKTWQLKVRTFQVTKKNNEKSNFHDKFMWKLQVLLPKGSETCYTWLKYFLRNTPGPAAQWIETLLWVIKNKFKWSAHFVCLVDWMPSWKEGKWIPILWDFAWRLGPNKQHPNLTFFTVAPMTSLPKTQTDPNRFNEVIIRLWNVQGVDNFMIEIH